MEKYNELKEFFDIKENESYKDLMQVSNCTYSKELDKEESYKIQYDILFEGLKNIAMMDSNVLFEENYDNFYSNSDSDSDDIDLKEYILNRICDEVDKLNIGDRHINVYVCNHIASILTDSEMNFQVRKSLKLFDINNIHIFVNTYNDYNNCCVKYDLKLNENGKHNISIYTEDKIIDNGDGYGIEIYGEIIID